jgi:beta-glucosidase
VVLTTYQDYDNIGAQTGGWTIAWQGYEGNEFWTGKNKETSHATSILDAIKAKFGASDKVTIIYNNYGSTNTTNESKINEIRSNTIQKIGKLKDMTKDNTIVIGVIAESPYAEMCGDIANPFCEDESAYNEDGCMYPGKKKNPYVPES